MRILLLSIVTLMVIACGRSDRERPARPAPAAPPVASNGTVSARVASVERRDDHLTIRLRLENLSEAPVEVKNLGDTLTGFRAQMEGRSFSADAYRKDDVQVAASRITSLPPHTPLELDLRWTMRPGVGTRNYDCTIVVGNLFQSDKRLPDVTIDIPGTTMPAQADEHAPGKDGDKDHKTGDAKPAGNKVAL